MLASGFGHDITLPKVSTYLPPDERDGQGVPLASIAMSISGAYDESGIWNRDVDFVGGATQVLVDTIAYAGTELRGVLVWSACPVPLAGPDTVEAPDLDLSLYRLEGAGLGTEVLIKHSSSFDHGVEIIHDAVDTTAVYRFRASTPGGATWTNCDDREVGSESVVKWGFAYFQE